MLSGYVYKTGMLSHNASMHLDESRLHEQQLADSLSALIGTEGVRIIDWAEDVILTEKEDLLTYQGEELEILHLSSLI